MIPQAGDWASSWANGFKSQAAKDKYKRSVQALKQSPGEAAAAAQDKYKNATADAVDSGRYRDGNLSYSLTDYQQAAVAGVDRFDSGAKKGTGKMAKFAAEFGPYLAQTQQMVKAMPNATESERDERMRANAHALRQFKRTRTKSRY